MKKIVFPLFVLLSLNACKSPEQKNTVKSSEAATTDDNNKVQLPASMSYNGNPSIGKTENIATVMTWNKNMIEGKVDSAAAYIADSLSVTLADGMHMSLSHDSAIAMLKGWRGSMDSAKQQYFTAIAVDNKTAGDEWVIQWTNETYYFKGGKKNQSALCESYLLKNGKIRQISQFEQKIPEKK
jgi:hypothetical protein